VATVPGRFIADIETVDAAALMPFPDLPPPRLKPPIPKTATNVPPAGREPPATRIVRIQPAELVGFDFSSIREVLRRPDDVQSSALSVVWVYSESMCTLRLFFYPDIQTRTFHLLKYDVRGMSGERLNDSSLCMQKLAAARKAARARAAGSGGESRVSSVP
jgi:hypothetical protein